jgi:sulfite reductase (NADPH) flavoprotein alpha-component
MLIHILFGSQTGNSQNLAHVISDSLENEGFKANIFDMGSVDPEKISEMSYVLVVTSTYGDGEPPDNASEWMSYLKFQSDLDLSRLHYSVLGLGDTYYPHFCQCGKDFDYYLSKHGGHRLAPRLDCDLYYEEQYGIWLEELITVLKNKLKE